MATTSVDRRGATGHSVSPTDLIRWSGIGTILAGILLPLYALLHPDHDAAGYGSMAWIPVHAMPTVGMIFLLFGLTGLLARQLRYVGRLGVVGYVVAFTGTAMVLTHGQVDLYVIPFLGLNAPHLLEPPNPPPAAMAPTLMLTAMVSLVGYVAIGVATVRARVLPQGVGVLLAVGGPAFVISYFLGQVPVPDAVRVVGMMIFGVALAWLGWELWTSLGRGPAPSLIEPGETIATAERH